MLVAAMNPCPCGFRGDALRGCRCTPHQLAHYRDALSGPLLDRIDLHVEVGAVPSSRDARRRGRRDVPDRRDAHRARRGDRQRARYHGERANADMTARELGAHARPDPAGAALLERAMSRSSACPHAPTPASSASRARSPTSPTRNSVGAVHVAEAIQYRSLDRRDADG